MDDNSYGFMEKSAPDFLQNTQRRSALRITRETELLGAQLYSYHSREDLVIGAKFLREDLPYFVELLSEVASKTEYQRQCCPA
jgi:ubiquinol-cytochrome c reductase core subunit 2